MKWKIDEHDRSVVVDEVGNDICCCSIPVKAVKNKDDCQWAYDNACLIAAAPETKKQRDNLLAACVKAHDALLALHVCNQDKPFAGETRTLLCKAIEQAEKD